MSEYGKGSPSSQNHVCGELEQNDLGMGGYVQARVLTAVRLVPNHAMPVATKISARDQRIYMVCIPR